VVPPLWPLLGSPLRFLANRPDHIGHAILSTDAWLTQHGLRQGKIPRKMRLRSH
jgi:hypothetical protein